MLTISERELKFEAKRMGYRPEMLEKVYRLLDLLEQIMSVPYLSDRLTLKGGTAINLFCTQEFPRLSVDLDFNYIGTIDKEIMQQERPQLGIVLLDICKRRQYELHRNPNHHAGGKTVLIYKSLMGTNGRLEIDLNFLFRVPLWETKWLSSPEWPKKTSSRVLDIHELAAGKLHALLERKASRDLYDSHQLLTKWPMDLEKLRLAFTVYAGMAKNRWQEIVVDNINFSVKDIRDKLIPVLKSSEAPGMSFPEVQNWATKLMDECKVAFQAVLPFRENEIEFLDRLQNYGEICPTLISTDGTFRDRINNHPLLNWRKQQKLENI